RIPDASIWALNHELTRRIERRRRPPADEHKREDTRKRECCAGGSQKYPGNLPSAVSRRSNDSCRAQDPVRKEYEQDPHEEHWICCRPSEDEHLWHPSARGL